jgi:hypothetical protein
MTVGAEDELGWFSHLGRRARDVIDKKRPGAQVPDAAETLWRSFDLADSMEQGLSREAATSFIAPLDTGRGESQLLIERSKDRAEYQLKAPSGEQLLLARVSKDGFTVDMYIPAGGDPPVAVGPAFTLAAQDAQQTEWTLTSAHCGCCQYVPPTRLRPGEACKRELARIRCWSEDLEKYKVMHMEVDLPLLRSDGTPNIWCPRSASSGGGCSECAGAARRTGPALRLVSRVPRWSPRLKTLVLDFFGRATCASAKNIQLELASNPSDYKERPEFLHGKVSENAFVVDYKYPLSMAQAFAMALATKRWQ